MKQIAILFIIATFIFHSCQRQHEIPMKIIRMEKDLFSIPIDSVRANIPRLEQQYGDLLNIYSIMTLRIGSPQDSGYSNELAKFLNDTDMKLVFEKVMDKYPELNDIEKGLGNAFYYYSKEFPDRAIPSVYTLISALNEPLIVDENILAIALDKYLGKNEEIYSWMDMPNYLRKLTERKYIVPQSMEAWITTEFPFNDSINNVLTNVLYQGKLKYCLNKILPNTPDSIIFGYSPNQMLWCKDNTARMWTHLVENKLLFSTDMFTIRKLIQHAPFSFSAHESPGRAVNWLGYQIITSYMKHNRERTLEELLLDNDYHKILLEAKFKP